jgi:hypothetical protein
MIVKNKIVDYVNRFFTVRIANQINLQAISNKYDLSEMFSHEPCQTEMMHYKIRGALKNSSKKVVSL